MFGLRKLASAILQRFALVLAGFAVALAAAEYVAPMYAPFALQDGRLSLLGERYEQRAPMILRQIDGVPMWFHTATDRPAPKPVKEGVRIVVLGDSVLMPAGLPERDGAVRLLERYLAESLDGGPYEVVNLAEGGWSTLQEEVRLRHEALALRPDLVVVGLTANDAQQYVMVDGQLVFAEFLRDADARGDHVLARRSYLWNWLWLVSEGHKVGARAAYSCAEQDSVLASLSRMEETARRAGSRLAILCLPNLPEDHMDPETASCGWPNVSAWAAREGVPFFDVAPAYAPYPMPLMRLDIMHLSAFGHRVLAAAWLRWLVNERLVPWQAVRVLPDLPRIPAPAER